MRLSDAIVLGDSLRVRNSAVWIKEEEDGRICGCALGGALLAVGETVQAIDETDIGVILHKHWPWLRASAMDDISRMFASVVRGDRSFEGVLEYVRSCEPPELVPQPAAVECETVSVT